MKLIVTGATGFVGTEVVRQALRHSAITSVTALTRRPVPLPAAATETTKFQSIVLEDWAAPYPEDVKSALQDADACIWTLAITPTKSKDVDFAEVTRVCHDYTMNGLKEMAALAKHPFRFAYTSGVATERDQSAVLESMGDYRLMRGRVENEILAFAQQHDGVEVTVTKPGLIDGPGRNVDASPAVPIMLKMYGHVPKVHVSELAAAMIEECVNGFTKEPLWSADCEEIGKRVLGEGGYLT